MIRQFGNASIKHLPHSIQQSMDFINLLKYKEIQGNIFAKKVLFFCVV